MEILENMDLRTQTTREWSDTVLSNFDEFLLDHASCERKASAVGMSFVVRYPDRPEIMDPMIHFAREELEHFHQVYKLIAKRGLFFGPDKEDGYVNFLMKEVRFGRQERFLDRLLVSGVIEARGTERLHFLADQMPPSELQDFYRRLARAEESHKTLFVKLATLYFPKPLVADRLGFWLDIEAKALAAQPVRPMVH